AELLALAGGDSSDDEGSKPTEPTNPSPPTSSSKPPPTNMAISNRRGTAQPTSSKTAARNPRTQRTRKTDSEEGEA
ncbi:MAG: hypothetical protein Q9183_007168, partial [Haloplaca sp. 2 TL-2023]